ncbi:MAG: hypothetical protein K8S13_10710 [Desulfobacula sp.]|uniref:hypothetical protein n=1 Tax=Desulfobacula sp. TaxID=2593537 RepID=UPI0025BC029A|nr:hypothetical protein [Desulfobacula sp.]MCD4720310.1 hypothetical protein [Desulfobacula sp.]
MLNLKQYKCISWIMLIFFTIFLFDNACFAKAHYPRTALIKFKVDARVKVKRVKGKIIPIEMKIKNRTFKFKKHQGQYGFHIKTRDMTNLVPDFKDKLGTSVTQLGLYRVKSLVKGDRAKAEEIVKQHRMLKKKASVSPGNNHLITTAFHRVLEGLKSLVSPNNAHAQDNIELGGEPAFLTAAAKMGVDKQLLSQLNQKYSMVLNSQSFFYPQVQPGRGGWDLVSETEDDSTSGGGSSDDNNSASASDETEAGDNETWYNKLLSLFMIAVVLLAPIAAIVFLCMNPFTLASVLLSLALANGAIMGAAIIDMTLGTIGDLLSGRSIFEYTDQTMYSTEDGVTFTDNSWSWP